ncbi:MAG: hypothetical protein Q4B46_11795 [Comamonadaceae bacterium]|nr:hypothetical protein [Comamonadaceae bacterium]
MSISPALDAPLSHHTFGRSHMEPPSLPGHIQQNRQLHAGQGNEGAFSDQQQFAGALPHDFDQRVRSVGEW